MSKLMLNVKNCLCLIAVMTGTVLAAGFACADTAPTYSVSISGGSFDPAASSVDKPSVGTFTASLNVDNPNEEYQKGPDHWTWDAKVTGFAASKDGTFGTANGTPPGVGATSGSATSKVTVTTSAATTGGYYQITVTATDDFDVTYNSVTTHESKSNSTKVSAAASKVDILYNGVVATGTTQSVIVGQGIGLSVQVTPSDMLPAPPPADLYQWNVSSDTSVAVKTYAAFDTNGHNESVGAPIALDNLNGLRASSVHFYWVSGGSQAVSCAVKGVSPAPSITFNISRPPSGTPNGAYVTGTPGVVSVDASDNTAGVVSLHCGNPKSVPGMTWTFNYPQGFPGSWQWVQLVSQDTVNNTEAPPSATQWSIQGHGYPALDGAYPYYTIQSSGDSDNDSPNDLINPFIPYPLNQQYGTVPPQINDIATVAVNQQFTDYYMFKPAVPDSIFVPIGKFTWGWDGNTARVRDQNNNLTSLWNPTNPAGSCTPGAYTDSLEWATWDRNTIVSSSGQPVNYDSEFWIQQ